MQMGVCMKMKQGQLFIIGFMMIFLSVAVVGCGAVGDGNATNASKDPNPLGGDPDPNCVDVGGCDPVEHKFVKTGAALTTIADPAACYYDNADIPDTVPYCGSACTTPGAANLKCYVMPDMLCLSPSIAKVLYNASCE
jgi:hypothetical protein